MTFIATMNASYLAPHITLFEDLCMKLERETVVEVGEPPLHGLGEGALHLFVHCEDLGDLLLLLSLWLVTRMLFLPISGNLFRLLSWSISASDSFSFSLALWFVEDCGPIADPQLEHLSTLDRVDSVRIGTGGPLDPQRLGLALSLLAALCTVRRRNLQTAVLSALCVESHASKRVLSTRAGRNHTISGGRGG